VYETLGLIAEHGGKAAAVYAAEILGAVLTTLPRALLHAGAEGFTCMRRVLLCDGVRGLANSFTRSLTCLVLGI
jgi:hypothetical protein